MSNDVAIPPKLLIATYGPAAKVRPPIILEWEDVGADLYVVELAKPRAFSCRTATGGQTFGSLEAVFDLVLSRTSPIPNFNSQQQTAVAAGNSRALAVCQRPMLMPKETVDRRDTYTIGPFGRTQENDPPGRGSRSTERCSRTRYVMALEPRFSILVIAMLGSCERAPKLHSQPQLFAASAGGCPYAISQWSYPVDCHNCAPPVVTISQSNMTVTLTETSPAWPSAHVYRNYVLNKGTNYLGCSSTGYPQENTSTLCSAPIRYQITC